MRKIRRMAPTKVLSVEKKNVSHLKIKEPSNWNWKKKIRRMNERKIHCNRFSTKEPNGKDSLWFFGLISNYIEIILRSASKLCRKSVSFSFHFFEFHSEKRSEPWSLFHYAQWADVCCLHIYYGTCEMNCVSYNRSNVMKKSAFNETKFTEEMQRIIWTRNERMNIQH